MRTTTNGFWEKGLTALGSAALMILAFTPLATTTPALAQNVITTPEAIPELPVEIEVEVSPAGSLKNVPLWKEIRELLEDPHAVECPADDPATLQFDESSECVATTERRPGFGNEMPPLRVFHPCFNVLTGQPLRMRPDGEIDWNQPGPLFDPDEIVAVEAGNVPTELRTVIGSLEVDEENNLYVVNINDDPRIPPNMTVVAEPACNEDGQLTEDGEVVTELEQPVNETHFLRDDDNTAGVPAALQAYVGRPAAEVMGKSLFWDMQVGSDSTQACGSCHFTGGVDNRTRNQLNPNTNGGDLALDMRGGATPQNTNAIDVVGADFPFRKLMNPSLPSEGDPAQVVLRDSNDVMSSMGVSRFERFDDVIVPTAGGPNPFGPAFMGVLPLMPDLGTAMPDPVPVNDGNRRIEPRNTPTFHSTAFNFDNFWDGRARHDYNGGSVFGAADPFFHVYVNCAGNILRPLAAPLEAEGPLCDWTEAGGNYLGVDEDEEPVPVRIRFSSLASQAMGPPLSNTEMAFDGRNWAKIGKKLLQARATPLAKQLVDPTDSRLGAYSNQGGSACAAVPAIDRTPGWSAAGVPGRPGLCISYPGLIKLAYEPSLWNNTTAQRLNGTAVAMNADCEPGEQIEDGILPTCDPFDGYVLQIGGGMAAPQNTNQFSQMQANFSLFFGLAVQTYEQLTIPDDTPWDRFNDANPLLGNGIAQPGEQGVLHPTLVRELVTGSPDPDVTLTLVEGFGEEEVFGLDIFAGGNLTAALPVGSARNPEGFGSNPFLRTARCMMCHLGPEQSDHTSNVNAGLLQGGTEIEFPTPPTAPEPSGNLRLVTGFGLAEELEENAQDGVEVENRNFAFLDDPATPWDDRQVASGSAVAFQDNGVYNIGVRPTREDIMRGGDDPFGWPLSLSALALKNLGGPDFEPCDTEAEAAFHPTGCALTTFDPAQGPGGGLFAETGDGVFFPGSTHTQQSINPGFQMEPINPLLPEYLAEWANNLPAGELSPLIDELAFAPNHVMSASVGHSTEYNEILFGADLHCGIYDPDAFGAGPPNFGWGPLCPNSQSGVPVNFSGVPGVGTLLNGTFPFPNRVARNGAVKVPQLRNIELTGPYFHTGSYLTLRQVVDFYVRGGDFPLTNAEDRDPNLVNMELQAFSFGATTGLPVQFQDAVPDAVSLYGLMPDTNPPGCDADPPNCTPEPERGGRAAALEDAKNAVVTFLLALTDERVAHRAAPFDQPEIFVPIDGKAPENTGGRAELVQLSGAPCPEDPVEAACFLQVGATGELGHAERVPSFLEISSTPVDGPDNDHFDR